MVSPVVKTPLLGHSENPLSIGLTKYILACYSSAMNQHNRQKMKERLARAADIRKRFPLDTWTITAIAKKLKISKQALSRVLRK
jgi:hypothetical protein